MPSYFYIDSVKVYDLGFSKFDKTKPNFVTEPKFLDNILSWDYSHDNIAVQEYKITINNNKVLKNIDNYIVLNPIDTMGATSAFVQAMDYSGNTSVGTTINFTPKIVNLLYNELDPSLEKWSIYTDSTTSYALAKQGKNCIMVDITTSGTNPWDIQLMKNGCELIYDTKYAYCISLRSTTNRKIKFAI